MLRESQGSTPAQVLFKKSYEVANFKSSQNDCLEFRARIHAYALLVSEAHCDHVENLTHRKS